MGQLFSSISLQLEVKRMKFRLKPGKRTKRQEEDESEETPVEALIGYLGLKRRGAPEGYIEVETYPLKPPFSYASIVQNENTADFYTSLMNSRWKRRRKKPTTT
jgi:hypothetical protein